jgi:hypothetical protein
MFSARVVAAALALVVFCEPKVMAASLITVVVPAELETIDGNDKSQFPFGYRGETLPEGARADVRFQQVFDASAFSRVDTGGMFLTRIFLRPDCSSYVRWYSYDFQVNLSTTIKAPDQLSSVFAENVGPDEQLVFGPKTYLPPDSTRHCPQPAGFGSGPSVIELHTPFFYDPSRGNLLVEFKQSNISARPNEILLHHAMDAHTVFGDAVSRIAAFSLSATTAEIVDTTGLVMAFQFNSAPSLTNRIENGALELSWSTWVPQFRLQWAERLESGAWTDYPGGVTQPYSTVAMTRIPISSLSRQRFFRLYWNTPQRFPWGEDVQSMSVLEPVELPAGSRSLEKD